MFLTRSCYYNLRRLRAIRRSVSSPVFTTIIIVHAFIWSRIDYCNSLYAGLPTTRLSSIQSVMNLTTRLIARLPRFSHISTYMTYVLLWFPVASRIRYKVLLLIARAQQGLAPNISATWCANCVFPLFPSSPVSWSPWSDSSPDKDCTGPTPCLCKYGTFYVEWPLPRNTQ